MPAPTITCVCSLDILVTPVAEPLIAPLYNPRATPARCSRLVVRKTADDTEQQRTGKQVMGGNRPRGGPVVPAGEAGPQTRHPRTPDRCAAAEDPHTRLR